MIRLCTCLIYFSVNTWQWHTCIILPGMCNIARMFVRYNDSCWNLVTKVVSKSIDPLTVIYTWLQFRCITFKMTFIHFAILEKIKYADITVMVFGYRNKILAYAALIWKHVFQNSENNYLLPGSYDHLVNSFFLYSRSHSNVSQKFICIISFCFAQME